MSLRTRVKLAQVDGNALAGVGRQLAAAGGAEHLIARLRTGAREIAAGEPRCSGDEDAQRGQELVGCARSGGVH